jgi:hypothetical protein
MGQSEYPWPGSATESKISFGNIIARYNALQKKVVRMIRALASEMSSATPGKFLLAQFAMSQVTQIGDSISNLIYQVNSVVNAAVRNQKVQ